MNFNGTFTQVIDELVQQVMPSLVVVRGRRFGRVLALSGMRMGSFSQTITSWDVIHRSFFCRMIVSTNQSSSTRSRCGPGTALHRRSGPDSAPACFRFTPRRGNGFCLRAPVGTAQYRHAWHCQCPGLCTKQTAGRNYPSSVPTPRSRPATPAVPWSMQKAKSLASMP